MRQSGFLLIFDFQGANSEKVELNKNCLWSRADVCKNKTGGGGGSKSETKQDKSRNLMAKIATFFCKENCNYFYLCYDQGLISAYFSKNCVVLLLVFPYHLHN